MRTQVAIIGAGPAGLLLSQILHQEGVSCVVIEKHSRAHVLGRIRAGVLEPTTVEVLEQYGLAERLAREGHEHDGMKIAWAGRESFLIDIHRHLGKRFVAYGQTNLQEDLFAAADRSGTVLLTEALDVQIEGVASGRPGTGPGRLLPGQPLRVAGGIQCHGAPASLECGPGLLVPDD